jgi:hypothetical protein
MTAQAQNQANARIGREAQAKIGRQLRALYAELIKQEENLRELIRRLSGRPELQ